MTLCANWHDLGQVGHDRHRTLLAEATRRRLLRQLDRRATGAPPQEEDARPPVAEPESPEECLRRRGGFTPVEWQRLVFLQWLYRRGQLGD